MTSNLTYDPDGDILIFDAIGTDIGRSGDILTYDDIGTGNLTGDLIVTGPSGEILVYDGGEGVKWITNESIEEKQQKEIGKLEILLIKEYLNRYLINDLVKIILNF